ncbi:uncharacterized protein [Onthophagus taurus]|uniref:uncharacterized protein n=1 Tax=Onthophagus taurus TaxID=166361 RepID=UPI0039BE2EE9
MQQLNSILTAGGFHARKWISNHPEILAQLPPDDMSVTKTVNFSEDDSPRAFGLLWNNESDQFLFVLNNKIEIKDPLTKRSVLSFIARLYDPLGLLSPFIITAKIFMQELWVRGLDWDDELPGDLAKKWTLFQRDLLNVPTIRVPRWLCIDSDTINIELHGFSDASSSAFGAVAYLRVEKLAEVRVVLIGSKTKVAPLKNVSIPRLELCAAVVLVRLIKRVSVALKLDNIPVFLWTDSTVTVSWILSHPNRWKDFVRNRVIEIQD